MDGVKTSNVAVGVKEFVLKSGTFARMEPLKIEDMLILILATNEAQPMVIVETMARRILFDDVRKTTKDILDMNADETLPLIMEYMDQLKALSQAVQTCPRSR